MLLGVPVEEILEDINVTNTVRAAILDGEGPGGTILTAVDAYTDADWERAEIEIGRLGADLNTLFDIYVDSITWAGARMAFAGARLDAQDPSPDTAVATVPAPAVPIFLTVGLGYGQRLDRCAYCASAKNTESFTGHVGIGKYVTGGLGVGVDASVWRRAHPGVPEAVDSLGGGATLPLASLVSLVVFANWNVGSYDLSTPLAVIERGVKHKYIELGFGLTLR